ncbi:uncharacterized protein LOC123989251 [Osmia bicornis bicornis]|uniref:uncharacterized protein LOC123989251 n=1 Tax=Osmia bicornis bicornis TaxID=1437191 RepID=UPI001EAEAAC3|nr:uncharacterized protein LOC123989251 [Osmia bicornis bicornis]
MHGNVQDHKKFISLIKAIVKEKFHIKYSEGSVSVHLQTLLDYENLKSIWKERGINFHTYTRKDEKKRVYVLNGLHNEVTTEDVQDELKEADAKSGDILQQTVMLNQPA